MKIYILTCISECGQLVTCKSYKRLSEAQVVMRAVASAESNVFQRIGRPGCYSEIGERVSAVGDEEYCYIWNITEDEI